MNDNIEEKDFTDILEELADEELLDEEIVPVEHETVTDDNVNDFILDQASKLVRDNMEIMDKVKDKIATAQDADEIKALAELMRATNSTLDTLTKISLQNKKEKSVTEVKQIEHEHRKELPQGPQTQIIVGTREDIFKKLAEAEKEATEIEVVEDE
jgi:hypothetical protein